MIWKLLSLFVFSSLAAYVFQILLFIDYGKRVYNHKPGPCRQLNGITNGSEDIALIEPEGLAFISSGVVNLENDRPNIEGNIFLFDLQNPSEDPIKLKIEGMENRTTFRPHGISHWVSGDRIRLYVISHTPNEFKHIIEVLDFDREKRSLKYVKSIRDEKFVRPNAIFAVGDDKFLISNDAEAQTSLANMMEVLMFKKSGSIVFFDGKESHWVAKGLMSPNGIATDREMKHLFIAHINDKSLGIYDLAKDFKSITEIKRIPLGTALDNLFLDADGYLWIGSHPVVKDLVNYWNNFDNPDFYAPSQVLRLKFSNEWDLEEATEVFVDDGRLLCASSGAVHFNGKMLIGSIFRQAVVCDIFEPL